MKILILSSIKKILLGIAVFSANTPSQVGTYQKNAPKQLKVKN